MSFQFNVQSNKNIWVVGGECISSAPTTSRNIILMLFANEPTIAADGSAFNPALAQMQNDYLGSISFSTFNALASNTSSDGTTMSGRPVIGTPDVNVIYGVAIAGGSQTPIAQEQITFKLDYQLVDSF